jgi:hypothetical protein
MTTWIACDTCGAMMLGSDHGIGWAVVQVQRDPNSPAAEEQWVMCKGCVHIYVRGHLTGPKPELPVDIAVDNNVSTEVEVL